MDCFRAHRRNHPRHRLPIVVGVLLGVLLSGVVPVRADGGVRFVGRDLTIAVEGEVGFEDLTRCRWVDAFGEARTGDVDDFTSWANGLDARPVGAVAECESEFRSKADGVRFSGGVELEGIGRGTVAQLCDSWSSALLSPSYTVESVDFSVQGFYAARRENALNCGWQVQLEDGSTLVGGTVARQVSSQLDAAEIGDCQSFPGETCVFARLPSQATITSGTGQFAGAGGTGSGELVFEWPLDPTRPFRQSIHFTADLALGEPAPPASAMVQPGARAGQPEVGAVARILVTSVPGGEIVIQARRGRQRGIVARTTAGADGVALVEVTAEAIRDVVGRSARSARLLATTYYYEDGGQMRSTRAAGAAVRLR